MRRITVLAIAAAVAMAGGLISFGLRPMGQQQASRPATVTEPELVTGAIVPRPPFASPEPPAAEVAVAPPASPETSPKPARSDTAANSRPTCRNPDALGVSRIVEIDTTGGPGFGFEHFKQHDFLRGSRPQRRLPYLVAIFASS